MALSKLYDASGNPLVTSDGQYLYVDISTVPASRVARVPKEIRLVKVGRE